MRKHCILRFFATCLLPSSLNFLIFKDSVGKVLAYLILLNE